MPPTPTSISLLNFSPPPAGLNGNQQNVANALINFFNTTGGIPLVFGALTPAGLTQVSGEIATGSQQTTFNAMNQFMGLMTDPFIAGRGDGVSAGGTDAVRRTAIRRYARAAPRARRLCGDLSPRRRRRPIASISAGACGRRAMAVRRPPTATPRWDPTTRTSRIFGTAVGADYRFSPNTLAGFALAGGGTNFSVANGSAPAAPTCSRPAPSCVTLSARPTSPPRWPMAGRTSPPIAP